MEITAYYGEGFMKGASKPITKSTRVMKRAVALYNKAKSLGITGITVAYYLTYSWTLEKGKVWLA